MERQVKEVQGSEGDAGKRDRFSLSLLFFISKRQSWTVFHKQQLILQLQVNKTKADMWSTSPDAGRTSFSKIVNKGQIRTGRASWAGRCWHRRRAGGLYKNLQPLLNTDLEGRTFCPVLQRTSGMGGRGRSGLHVEGGGAGPVNHAHSLRG